jgi:hypothetical protein
VLSLLSLRCLHQSMPGDGSQQCILLQCSRSYRRSESELLYDWRFTANQFVLATSPLRLKTSNMFQLSTCGHTPYVTSSMMREWVCRLQLFLASPAQLLSGSSPAGLMTTFYCLKFETPPTWMVRFPYLYPPGTGWPTVLLITFQHGPHNKHRSSIVQTNCCLADGAENTIPLFLFADRCTVAYLAGSA